ncbi:MBL fold metallo-hydrolase [Terrarubrum flagellatum]|uniref:MBL fold metallo-hydrolase n=1 Tax=Terrirubrum flagellatum TaxID=2895980 RepID=UPI0031453724
MRLTLLGTGSPLPSLTRASTGHLIEENNQKILIDVGPGAVTRLLECGVQPTDIDNILLSHLHFDHVGDLARTLFCCWDRFGGIRALPEIIGPKGTRRMIDKLFGPDGAFQADLTARTSHARSLDIYLSRGGRLPRPWPNFAVTEIEGAGSFNLPDLQITYSPVQHHQPYLDSFSYRVEGKSGVVCYTSDIAIGRDPQYCDSLRTIASNVDVLVHYLNSFEFDAQDAASSKPILMGQLANDLNVRRLVTTHHGPAMDKPGVSDAVLNAVRSVYKGEIYWGVDKLTFDVKSHDDVSISIAPPRG